MFRNIRAEQARIGMTRKWQRRLVYLGRPMKARKELESLQPLRRQHCASCSMSALTIFFQQTKRANRFIQLTPHYGDNMSEPKIIDKLISAIEKGATLECQNSLNGLPIS